MNAPARLNNLQPTPLNRARGHVRLSVQSNGTKTGIEDLYQAGALKAVFPRTPTMTCVLVNTAGGVTGGDQFSTQAHVGTQGHLTLTTQAAERAYRARAGETGRVRTTLSAESYATLRWVPQETILFDDCNLDRCLRVDLKDRAEALIVEPMIFGRAAMGETRIKGTVRDRIEVTQNGRLVYLDSWAMDGDITAQLDRPAIGQGASAMASIILVSDSAETALERMRALLPDTAGASLKAANVLCMRFLAQNGYLLRKALLPILDDLTHNSLPTCWRL